MVIVAMVVAVFVMVIVAVFVMVIVAMVVAVVIVAVVVVCVSATHLQHDKIERFDARGFEFKHVLAFLKAVDVNHRVSGARSGTVDGFLGGVMLVSFVMVMFVVLVLVMVRLGDLSVVDVGGSPSDVLGFVQHHAVDAHLAGFPVVTGFVPDQQGPVPRSVGVNAANPVDHVSPAAKRGVPGDVVGREGSGGQVPARGVLREVIVLGFHRDGGVVGVVNNDHVVLLFVLLVLVFFSGEVHRFVGAFVEVFAQVCDEDRLKLEGDVAVGHRVGGHGLRG